MFELSPATAEAVAFYRTNLLEFEAISVGLSRKPFSSELRRQLKAALKDDEPVRLIESVVQVFCIEDLRDRLDHKKAVAKLLRSRGVPLRRGKRAGDQLVSLVSKVAPLLLFFGLPIATSERSKLVVVLRLLANELEIKGDPRDELRRLKRLKEEQHRRSRQVAASLFSVAARAIAPRRKKIEYLPP